MMRAHHRCDAIDELTWKRRIMMAEKNQQIAQDILAAVGGNENITTVLHCMTRLRLTLKDQSVPKLEEINHINGVLGSQVVGGQLQIIVGQNVNKVYDEFCKLGGFAKHDGIQENIDGPKEKLTLKRIGGNILDYLSGSLSPFIPVMLAAAMFKTVMVLFGPDMLNLFSAESDLYVLFTFLYDAGFYFMPIYLGYTASKKLGVTPVLGMYMGCVLLAPAFVAMAQEGAAFSVYGIPCRVMNYSQSVMPILLIVWVMSYVERFFKKVVPTALSTIFTPFLTAAVMMPLALCVLAPIGGFVGDYVGAALVSFSENGGFIAVAVIAALWEFLVMTGMHSVVIITAITIIMQQGQESCIMVAGGMATWAAFGMALGAFFRLKDKNEKSLSMGYFISGLVGGVTEPALYGIGFKYKKAFIALAIGGFLGGLYAGIMHVTVYVMGATNFLSVLGYVSGGTSNLMHGIIGNMIALFSTAILTYFIGFDKKDLAKNEN